MKAQNKKITIPSKEYLWLCDHPEEEAKYEGEWIAVVVDKIVAHGKKLQKVREKAYSIGEHPYFAYIVEEAIWIFYVG